MVHLIEGLVILKHIHFIPLFYPSLSQIHTEILTHLGSPRFRMVPENHMLDPNGIELILHFRF